MGQPMTIVMLLHLLCVPAHPPSPQSDLVKVFVGRGAAPHEVSRISSVGSKAHGLVAWGPRDLLMLDSEYGALVSVDVATGNVYDFYVVRFEEQGRGGGPRAGVMLGKQHVGKLDACRSTSPTKGLRMAVIP